MPRHGLGTCEHEGSDSVGERVGWRFCISNKPPGEAHATDSRPIGSTTLIFLPASIFLLLGSASSGVPDVECQRADEVGQFCAPVCQYRGGLGGGSCGAMVHRVHSGRCRSATGKCPFLVLHCIPRATFLSSSSLSLTEHCRIGRDVHY